MPKLRVLSGRQVLMILREFGFQIFAQNPCRGAKPKINSVVRLLLGSCTDIGTPTPSVQSLRAWFPCGVSANGGMLMFNRKSRDSFYESMLTVRNCRNLRLVFGRCNLVLPCEINKCEAPAECAHMTLLRGQHEKH